MFKRLIYQGSIWFPFLETIQNPQNHIFGAQDSFDKEIFQFWGLESMFYQGTINHLKPRSSHQILVMEKPFMLEKIRSTKEVGHSVRVSLLPWQHLASRCEQAGFRLYKMRPKHHCFSHIGFDIPRTRLNPRLVQSCHHDESFLGYIRRIGVKCDQASLMGRLFQRYILCLSLRWRDTAQKN